MTGPGAGRPGLRNRGRRLLDLAANLGDAFDLYRSLGHRLGEAETLSNLGVLQRSTGDYTAAEATSRQALEIFRDLGDRPYQAWVLNDLGMVQQLTGDHKAPAARHQRAFELFRDLGNRLGQARSAEQAWRASDPDPGHQPGPRLAHPDAGHRP
jgi:tetratricopeptide (TPR) repeat protein